MSRLPSRLAAIGVGVALLLLLLGLAEAVVRLAGPDLSIPAREGQFRFDQTRTASQPAHVRDPELGWRLAPGEQKGMRINDQGFRTPPFTSDKPPGTHRIVVLGDSNPLGFGVGEESAPYARQLETHLDRRAAPGAPDAEVLNLAVDGYSSYQARVLAERWLPRLSPDVVCLQAGFNDFCFSSRPDGPDAFVRPPLLDALESSHAYRWLRRVLLSRFTSRTLERPVRRVDVEASERNVRAVVASARSAGASEVVLITTAVRPTVPVIVNEVRVVADGRERWVTQADWLDHVMAEAGLEPPYPIGNPTYIATLQSMTNQSRDWSLPPYLLASAFRRMGRAADAAKYDALWRARDVQRTAFRAYEVVLARVAADTGATLVDSEATLRASTPDGSLPDTFVDFIHLDEAGHAIIGETLAERLGGS